MLFCFETGMQNHFSAIIDTKAAGKRSYGKLLSVVAVIVNYTERLRSGRHVVSKLQTQHYHQKQTVSLQLSESESLFLFRCV